MYIYICICVYVYTHTHTQTRTHEKTPFGECSLKFKRADNKIAHNRQRAEHLEEGMPIYALQCVAHILKSALYSAFTYSNVLGR